MIGAVCSGFHRAVDVPAATTPDHAVSTTDSWQRTITAGSEEAISTALSKIESNVAPRDFERPNDFEPLEYGKDVVVELESFPTGLPGQPVFWLAALMVRSRNLMSVLHHTVDPVSTNRRWLRLSKSVLGVFADLLQLWKRTFLTGALPRAAQYGRLQRRSCAK